ncbi:pyridoxal phosphate-dependent enzyme, YggS family [Psychroflexus torquis ATCC 700755]|uniref:Pyridoxal phosphate homeostasis protein n=1 Tax=Psychroflexus torquis (strain ATCC 700755 / CIP 106069 / ACAM 623) TaxID=313595 RepID=K4ICH1_PSYTT|nr:YggS family pyridoxal phosphate-dependent enzyme [Psychroflexus torquis]AFU67573.1 pyridoxal phosphate-dependent enzyme, YggS family [Psychroflexus torquis ATCC 700755]
MEGSIKEHIKTFTDELGENIDLVAVSKTKPNEDLLEAYKAGQRIFGENKVQEMTDKWDALPKDIKWHMVGHVQTNKVKYMAPYVDLIHAVQNMKLLKEINKRAVENDRVIDCLLQVKIAEEESKYGMSPEDLKLFLKDDKLAELKNVRLKGLMAMATFTEDEEQIHREFKILETLYKETSQTQKDFSILSMGMSGDYKIAMQHDTNMVRIGSSIFGAR